ncbi:MAG: hypothetical protein ABI663_20765 [Chryseolinea sp.]
MDFEQWKLYREIEEENSSFNEVMRHTTASTSLFAGILLGMLVLIVGLTLLVS